MNSRTVRGNWTPEESNILETKLATLMRSLLGGGNGTYNNHELCLHAV